MSALKDGKCVESGVSTDRIAADSRLHMVVMTGGHGSAAHDHYLVRHANKQRVAEQCCLI